MKKMLQMGCGRLQNLHAPAIPTTAHDLCSLGVHVIPESFTLGAAHHAFGEQRHMEGNHLNKIFHGVGVALARTTESPRRHIRRSHRARYL
jgi:hypothetical protein